MEDGVLIKIVKTLQQRIALNPTDYEATNDLLTALSKLKEVDEARARPYYLEFKNHFDKNMRFLIENLTQQELNKFVRLDRMVLNVAARFDLDSYFRFIEWERPAEQQFYMPRRSQFLKYGVTQALQDLVDDKIDLLCLSLPPGVGKTTIAEMTLTFLAGRDPELPILTASHSGSFLDGVYRELLRMLDPEGEYLFNEVFPESPVVSTNAQNLRIDLQRGKRFETLQFTSIGAGNAGKLRCENLLYCDDLVSGIEEALSRDRMEKLWQQYVTDLRQRKKGHCRELHIATRWSVHDPIGKLNAEYRDNDRARFIAIPALDENDESNFDYKFGVGFDTKYYVEQRKIMSNSGDDASWRALFLNEPIEREGQLYHPDELRRYFELPTEVINDEEIVVRPDIIVAVVDTKEKGKDYCVMPIGYVYGSDVYIEDIICDNGRPEIVEEKLAQALVKHKVQLVDFESNSAGGKIAQAVQERVKELGGRTKVVTHFTRSNKETKILAESPWVKEHCLFKDASVLKAGATDYILAERLLTSYSLLGRNPHDDVPDAFAQLSQYIQSFAGNKVTVFKRPF